MTLIDIRLKIYPKFFQDDRMKLMNTYITFLQGLPEEQKKDRTTKAFIMKMTKKRTKMNR